MIGAQDSYYQVMDVENDFKYRYPFNGDDAKDPAARLKAASVRAEPCRPRDCTGNSYGSLGVFDKSWIGLICRPPLPLSSPSSPRATGPRCGPHPKSAMGSAAGPPLGVAISIVWSMLGTVILLKLIDASFGLRVGVDEELLVGVAPRARL